jgi:hypothetical protein
MAAATQSSSAQHPSSALVFLIWMAGFWRGRGAVKGSASRFLALLIDPAL